MIFHSILCLWFWLGIEVDLSAARFVVNLSQQVTKTQQKLTSLLQVWIALQATQASWRPPEDSSFYNFPDAQTADETIANTRILNRKTTFRLQAWAVPQAAGYAGQLVAVRMDVPRFRKVLSNSDAHHRKSCAKRTLVLWLPPGIVRLHVSDMIAMPAGPVLAGLSVFVWNPLRVDKIPTQCRLAPPN